MDSPPSTSLKITAVICLLGAGFGWPFLSNAIYSFDDMYFLSKIPALIDQRGHLLAALDLFAGADLKSEYRTYGLSRLVHFFAYLVFGENVYGYALIILMSHIAASLLIFRISSDAGTLPVSGYCLAIAWLFSPFSINWSFHHYTYALLPFQILLGAYYLIAISKRASFLALSLCGVACALTGELQLAAVPIVFAFAFYMRCRRYSDAWWRTSWTAGAFIIAVLLHRLCWVIFLRDADAEQRFTLSVASVDGFLSRVHLTVGSIGESIAQQLRVASRSGLAEGAVLALSVCIAVWFLFLRASSVRGDSQSNLRPVSLLFIGIAFASLGVYIAVSVLSGQISEAMPRRYGFGSLSMLLVGIVGLGAVVFRKREKAYAIAITFCVTMVTSQALVVEVPLVRSIDRAVLEKMQGSLLPGKQDHGVYFYVASDPAYELNKATSATRGVLVDSPVAIEFFQSPLQLFWTAQHYFVHVLKRPFAAIASDKSKPAAGVVAVNDAGQSFGRGQVLANLDLESSGPYGSGIRIFQSYSDFEPERFGKRVDRTIGGATRCSGQQQIIDIGNSEAMGSGINPDKAYGDQRIRPGNFMRDYGYIGSGHSEFAHPNFDGRFSYFATNRHGTLSYRISFEVPISVEISFDFWEQWGRSPGDRIFDLDVSWDGLSWANVGTIDPAALNGDKNFSIVVERRQVGTVNFRLVPVRGDVPFIQGLRICKVQD